MAALVVEFVRGRGALSRALVCWLARVRSFWAGRGCETGGADMTQRHFEKNMRFFEIFHDSESSSSPQRSMSEARRIDFNGSSTRADDVEL
jgi:hypothetical protein